MAIRLGSEVNFFPVITVDITNVGEFLQCHAVYFTSLFAGDCIDSKNDVV